MNTRPFNPVRTVFAAAALTLAMAAHAASALSLSTGSAALQNLGVPAPAADIHDIRGPKPITSPWLIPLVAVTALLAVVGGCAAWTWNRRHFQESSKRPLDIALERLDKARRLMEPPRGRQFSIEVSSAVRDYIENRFDIRAAHLTTVEFLHQLLEPLDSFLSAHRSELDHFLQTCDLAKFGGWNLGATDMEAMLQSARQFIVAAADETRSPPQQTPLTATAAVDQFHASTSRETYASLPSA